MPAAAALRTPTAELGARIATQQELLDAKRGEYTGLSEAALAGQTVVERWLEDHGVELEQAAASELELAARRERAWREAAIRARYDTPPDLTAEIGERPDSLLDAERWDRAAAPGVRARPSRGFPATTGAPGPARHDRPGRARRARHRPIALRGRSHLRLQAAGALERGAQLGQHVAVLLTPGGGL